MAHRDDYTYDEEQQVLLNDEELEYEEELLKLQESDEIKRKSNNE